MLYSKTESLGEMAKQLGYTGKGRNGTVRRMWIGEIGIPEHRLEIISQITNIPMSKIYRNSVSRSQCDVIDDWLPVMEIFKKNSNPKPDIFENIL